MTYEIDYGSGRKIAMTQEEVNRFLSELQNGKELVEFKGNILTKFFRVISKKEQSNGRLHDGTKVIRLNGRWVDEVDPSLKLDQTYYPEIANDMVMAEEEWAQKMLLN